MLRTLIALVAACATVASWSPAGAAGSSARACERDGWQRCLAIDATGNIYVAGAIGPSNGAALLVKYEGQSGAQVWSWAGLPGVAAAVIVDAAGNPVITGGSGSRTIVLKLDGLSGMPLWQRLVSQYQMSTGTAIAADPAGDIYVASAETQVLMGTPPPPPPTLWPWTVMRKLGGASGADIWTRSSSAVNQFSNGAIDIPYSMSIDVAGDAVVARTGGIPPSTLAIVTRVNPMQPPDWGQATFGSGLGFYDAIPSGTNDVFAIGFSGLDGVGGLATRLNGATGDPVWNFVSTTTGPIRAAAIDGDGNLIAAGGYNDLVVTKLSGADGSVLWQNRYSTTMTDLARAILLDESGDAYVAGDTGSNAIVARFRGSDGALLWTRVVDPGGYGGTLRALAWLPGGDFAAAGMSGSDILLQRFTRSGETVWKSGYVTAPLATLGSANLVFDPQPVGTASAAKSVTLTNTGSGDLYVVDVAVSGDFAAQGCAAGTMLPPAASCTLSISFSPTASGARTGSVAMTDNAAGNPHVIALSGTGLQNPPRATALSTRMQVLTGDDVLIGGFIVGGAVPKTVIVRARGPSLAQAGIANPLADPVLQLFSASGLIAANDDWAAAANAAAVSASGFAPADAKESAILATLQPGAYTAIVSGSGGTTGVGIVEVYEIDHPEAPLTAISTRGRVQTGDNVMIGGFIVNGSAPQTVVVRARGPSLASNGIADPLANPTLTLVGNGFALTNDDWAGAPNAAQIQSSGFAPRDSRESAMLVTLDPGAYTAIVAGVGGATGVAIVEVFAQ